MTTEELPSISDATCLSYLNEGAANVVYRIQIRSSTPPPSQLEEYGDGTPPPSEIESDLDAERYNTEGIEVFKSMCCLRSCSLFRVHASLQ